MAKLNTKILLRLEDGTFNILIFNDLNNILIIKD